MVIKKIPGIKIRIKILIFPKTVNGFNVHGLWPLSATRLFITFWRTRGPRPHHPPQPRERKEDKLKKEKKKGEEEEEEKTKNRAGANAKIRRRGHTIPQPRPIIIIIIDRSINFLTRQLLSFIYLFIYLLSLSSTLLCRFSLFFFAFLFFVI